jgi:hypothetical protein
MIGSVVISAHPFFVQRLSILDWDNNRRLGQLSVNRSYRASGGITF